MAVTDYRQSLIKQLIKDLPEPKDPEGRPSRFKNPTQPQEGNSDILVPGRSEQELDTIPEDYQDPGTVKVLGDPSKEGAERYAGRQRFAESGPGNKTTGRTQTIGEATPEQVAQSQEGFAESIGAERDTETGKPRVHPDYSLEGAHPDYNLGEGKTREKGVARKAMFDWGAEHSWSGQGGWNFTYRPPVDGEGPGTIEAVHSQTGKGGTVDPSQKPEMYAAILAEFFRGEVGEPLAAQQTKPPAAAPTEQSMTEFRPDLGQEGMVEPSLDEPAPLTDGEYVPGMEYERALDLESDFGESSLDLADDAMPGEEYSTMDTPEAGKPDPTTQTPTIPEYAAGLKDYAGYVGDNIYAAGRNALYPPGYGYAPYIPRKRPETP